MDHRLFDIARELAEKYGLNLRMAGNLKGMTRHERLTLTSPRIDSPGSILYENSVSEDRMTVSIRGVRMVACSNGEYDISIEYTDMPVFEVYNPKGGKDVVDDKMARYLAVRIAQSALGVRGSSRLDIDNTPGREFSLRIKGGLSEYNLADLVEQNIELYLPHQ